MALAVFVMTTVVAAQQIETPERLEFMRRTTPEVDSPELHAIIHDERTLWYSDESMPPAYQQAMGDDGDEGETRFVNVMFNVSLDRDERVKGHGKGGNANVEFPWQLGPGGTHESPNVDSFKFLHIPQGESINWFMHGLPKQFSTGTVKGYGWVFPPGTTVGEVLLHKSPHGRPFAFELRTRERTQSGWVMAVYRPYPTADDLIAAILKHRPGYQRSPVLTAAIDSLQNPVSPVVRRLVDVNHPDRIAFDRQAGEWKAPPLGDNALIDDLHDTVFRECLGEEFVPGCAVPTTQESWHLWPKNYLGAFVGASSRDCMACHEGTLRLARRFDARRGWYGFIRGSDGIFSFHPIATYAIGNGTTMPVKIRKELRHLVQPWNGVSDLHRIRGVR